MTPTPIRRPKKLREVERDLVRPILTRNLIGRQRDDAIYKAIADAGYLPKKPRRDRDGICLTCGETGRCPGFHIAGWLHEFYKREGRWEFMALNAMYVARKANGWIVQRMDSRGPTVDIGVAPDLDHANELLTRDMMANRPPRRDLTGKPVGDTVPLPSAPQGSISPGRST